MNTKSISVYMLDITVQCYKGAHVFQDPDPIMRRAVAKILLPEHVQSGTTLYMYVAPNANHRQLLLIDNTSWE